MEMIEIAPRIAVTADIQGGRPVIKGTRIPVDIILGQMAAGLTHDDIIKEYGVIREDVLAVLSYAAQTLARDQVHATAK